MNELKDELLAAPTDAWTRVPYTVNHHKWFLLWCRFGEGFCFSFSSPKRRMYSFYTEGNTEGNSGVTSAEIVAANGDIVASYYDSWDDRPGRKDAVLRLTPKHIIDRLYVLLGAIE